jgi:predicted PurR-regulated permease PerM
MSETKLEAYFFTAVFIAVLVLVAFLFYPFIGPLAVAIVLATLASPLYEWMRTKVKHEGFAAFLVVIVITLAVVIPVTALFFMLAQELQGITEQATALDPSGTPHLIVAAEAKFKALFPMFASVDMESIVRSITQNVGVYMAGALASTAGLLLKLFVAIIALFYLIKDGQSFVRVFMQLSPLSDDEDAQIVKKLKAVTQSLLRGTLVIACAQGALTGIGFVMFGIPDPVLWGSVAAVATLIPNIGTGLVLGPAVIYLALTGQTAAAIGLGAWSVLIVGMVDNILAARLVGRGAKIHPLFVLLSVMGGLSLFGLSGFLLGPLVFGLLVALFEIYKVKIGELHQTAGD